MIQTKNNWKKRTLLFLVSQCITLFGSTLVQMAIIWYVTIKTSSGAWIAAFSICSYLPQFLISFIGGVWADRYNRKKLIIFADTLIAIVTLITFAFLPFLSTEPMVLSILLLMSIIRSLGAGIQTPAVNAVIPQLVPEEYLMQYNGINATMQSIVQFAAPAAAGVILSVLSLRFTLLVDVMTAALGIGLFTCVMMPKQEIIKEKSSIFADIKAGLAYSFSDRIIGKLLVVYGMFVLLCVPAGFMAGLLVSRVYGDTYWYLTAVELVGFAGMTIGGLLMGAWGGFKSRIKTLVLGLLSFGVMAIGMGIVRNFILYLIMMALYGIALTMIQTATTTLIQERAIEEMQGRVFGLMGAMYSGCLPMGMAIFGPMADIISLEWIMVASGLALIIIGIAVRLNKTMYGKECEG